MKILMVIPAIGSVYGGPSKSVLELGKSLVKQGIKVDLVTTIANGETESGITIHYVNEAYDDGEIIFQDSIEIEEGDSAEDLAYKIHQLEYRHYPGVIESILLNLEE